MEKSRDALRTISEVADWLGVPTHVLRFWESRFSQVRPIKRAGARRYYSRSDMALLGGIRKLLYEDGLTIRGVQKVLREQGVKSVAAISPPLDGQPDSYESKLPVSDSHDRTEPRAILSGEAEPPAPASAAAPETVDLRTPGSEADATAADRELPDMPDETPESDGMPDSGLPAAEVSELHEAAGGAEQRTGSIEESAEQSQTIEPDQPESAGPPERHEAIGQDPATRSPSESGAAHQLAEAGPDSLQAKDMESEDQRAFLNIYERLLALRERMDSES